MGASRDDWLGGRHFGVDRYLHGATLEETVATGIYCLVTGKRRDSNVYFVRSGETWVLVDTGWRGRADLIRSAEETLFGVGTRPWAIVLTHVHPDHAGAASELARIWRRRVRVPRRTAIAPLWPHHRRVGPGRAVAHASEPGNTHLLGYRALRTRAPRSVAVSAEIAAPVTVQSLLREVEG